VLLLEVDNFMEAKQAGASYAFARTVHDGLFSTRWPIGDPPQDFISEIFDNSVDRAVVAFRQLRIGVSLSYEVKALLIADVYFRRYIGISPTKPAAHVDASP
jgi:hypothetical protein